MDKKAVAWLYKQLPELVEQGVIPAESAGRIREHYGPLPQGLGRRTLFVAFGLIGSVLVGLGIILILGHNWDQLSRLTRLLISLGVLVAAQIMAGLALWRKKDSTAWLEGTAAFLMLAVGGSIAVVGQVYHLADDFKNFIMVWMLLSLPLVYLMKVKGVAGMYLVGVMAWLAAVQPEGMIKQAAWALLALVLPYYWRLLKTDRYANAAVVLSWLLVICFYFCFSLTGDKKLWVPLYATLFSSTLFIGLLWFNAAEKVWQKPFQVVGLLGGVAIAYFLSYKTAWAYSVYHLLPSAGQGEYLLAFCLLVMAAGLGFLLVKRNLAHFILLGAFPVVAWFGCLLQSIDISGMYAAALVNVFLLGLSITVITKGVRETRLGVLNAGMLMLALLIVFRFFDFSYSFVARGVIFILCGMAFIAVNLVLSRRKNGVAG